MNETREQEEVRITGDAFDAAAETLEELVRAMDRECRVLPNGAALRELFSSIRPGSGKEGRDDLKNIEYAMILGAQAELKRQMTGADELLAGLDELCESENKRLLESSFKGKAS